MDPEVFGDGSDLIFGFPFDFDLKNLDVLGISEFGGLNEKLPLEIDAPDGFYRKGLS